MMLAFTPLNIILALIFYPMFISKYHKEEPFLFNLFCFVINAVVALYQLFFYFVFLK